MTRDCVVFATCFYLIFAAAEVSNPRWCHREHKSVGGKWMDHPPYWELPNCPNQAFGVEATRKCMTGRTLYVIGNSIARQNAFGMVELLGGAGVKREDQRDMCPKTGLTWGSSCSQELAGVKIRYLSLQFMDGFHYEDRGGFPYYKQRVNSTTGTGTHWVTGRIPSKPSVEEDEFRHGEIHRTFDNCKDMKTSECLKRFFEGSTEDDVLMFTMGMWYCFNTLAGYKDQDLAAKNDWLIDFPAWIAGSSTNFKDHITRHFKGHVFHSTLAAASTTGHIPYKSAWFRDTNEILSKVWTHSSVAPRDMWYTIDQWPINQGRDHLYVDAIHFTGILTHATLYQMLNELCTGEGDDALVVQTPRPDLANSIIVIKESLTKRQKAKALAIGATINITENIVYYLIDNEGYRHEVKIHTDKLQYLQAKQSAASTPTTTAAVDYGSKDMLYFTNNIPIHLSHYGRVELAENVARNISISFEYTELKEGTLIKGQGKEVYWFRNGTKQTFNGLATFVKYGLDFDQVVGISHVAVQAIPNGPPVV